MPPVPWLYMWVKSWKNCIKSDFKERFLWNLKQMGKVIRPFCWHQNFVPWGLSALFPGLYACIKSWKNCKESDFKDIFFKTCNKWMKWQDILLTSKLCPLWAVCPSPSPSTIYLYKNHEKKLYKIRLQRDFFETCNKWPKWQDVLLTSKFRPQGVVCPWPPAIYIY